MSHRPTFRFARYGRVLCLTTGLALACSSSANEDGAIASGGGASSGGQAATSGGAVSTSGGSSGGALSPASGGLAHPASGGEATSGGASGASGGSATGGRLGRGGSSGGSAGSTMKGMGRGGDAGTGSGGSTGSSGSFGSGGTTPGGSGGTAEVPVPPGYKLVWHEEFDVDGKPSAANWNYESGFVRNEEAQWYQSDNASISGGLLIIEARKERVKNSKYTGSGDWKTSREYAEYTSTSMTTNGLQSWQYGRFEMRARIPTAAGMWPAWWTLGVSGEWPSNGEIDIMEYYAGKVLANVACGTSKRWEAKWSSKTKPLSELGSSFSSTFHVWRMDWDDQKIDLYLDDELLNSTPLSSMLNPDGKSPFKQKAYMIVNLALGGQNGGDPARTTFPQRYEVDYLRVFQKQ